MGPKQCMQNTCPSGRAAGTLLRAGFPCLQYYKNFKGFKNQVDVFRDRLQQLLTSLPVRPPACRDANCRCLATPEKAHWQWT